MLLNLLILLYVACAVSLTVYACSQLFLLVVYLRHRHDAVPTPAVNEWPTVVVQLPLYNERYVVGRLLDAMAALDYPREKLTVQVLDDSTDTTVEITAAKVAVLSADGLNIQHVRRLERTGYKAGALAYGMTLTDAEYMMVLDADFVPPPDFLRKTIPHLVTRPKLGMVQTRWGHLNPFGNLLTLGQTLALDSHFVVEQTARSRGGWLMTFNGSGGVWRTKCIQEAGGWRDLTLTEDLDLSYRAQLAGWEFLYLPDVVVPGELPPQIAAYKQQQARWAKGTTQTLGHTLSPLWRSDFSLSRRVMATLHLCQYMPHPLMMVLLILTPPLLVTNSLQHLSLSVLGVVGLVTPLIYVISQQALYIDWAKRLMAFPVLMALGTGIAWSNTQAVLSGLLGRSTEFRRTPKFAKEWQISGYALKRDPALWVELLLAIYSLWGTYLALRLSPALAPWLGVYSFSFVMIVLWGIRDRMALHRAQQVAPAQ
ncbi:MAG: glycosyltransferase [Chloroflexi bacterium]|nr:glycosyltransferase [Chloroflexota bacterium]MCC6892982.1 glycosyltransferase [Anaerolineae bacterium]